MMTDSDAVLGVVAFALMIVLIARLVYIIRSEVRASSSSDFISTLSGGRRTYINLTPEDRKFGRLLMFTGCGVLAFNFCLLLFFGIDTFGVFAMPTGQSIEGFGGPNVLAFLAIILGHMLSRRSNDVPVI